MKKRIYKLFLFFLILILLYILINNLLTIIDWNNDNIKTTNEIDEIKELQDNELSIKNDDFIGTIKIENTNIDYPFVQANNNTYYLNHSFDKSHNQAGWIFLDYRNNFLNDKNTIIYGHARKDKTMFGTLKYLLKKEWFTKNKGIITISLDNHVYNYQIISVFHEKTNNYYYQNNFTTKEYIKFLNTIKNKSIYNFNIDLSINDKILTLSTCYSTNEKLLIFAKLII